MSSISFGGLATGIDSQSIVTQLMSLERAPQRLLQAQQTKNKSKISEFQKIADALTSLQTLVRGFKAPATFNTQKTSVVNSALLTASASSSATPGNHTVQVVSLARNQRQVSAGVSSNTDLVFSSGSFTINDGSSLTTVTVAEGQNSLQEMASAINGSGANVSASIINDGTNYRLVVTGKDTKNYTLDFTGLSTPPAGGTGALTPALLGPGDATYQAGAGAHLIVDGVDMIKTSNTITDAIQGVTLNLLTEGSATEVSVSNDTAAVSQKINDFATAYNKSITLVNAVSARSADTKTASVLSGDRTVQMIQQQLRSLLTATVSGATGSITGLSALGVNSDSKTGTLTVDATKLSDALSNRYGDVVDYFSHNGDSLATLPANQYGIAQQFNLVLDGLVHPYLADGMSNNGLIEVRKKGLTNNNAEIDKQISAMEARVLRMQAAMQKKFSAMEVLVSNLQKQGSSLLSILGTSTNRTNG